MNNDYNFSLVLTQSYRIVSEEYSYGAFCCCCHFRVNSHSENKKNNAAFLFDSIVVLVEIKLK